MKCKNCNSICIKRGFNNSVQRLFCKSCKRYWQKTYTYRLYTESDEATIIKLNNIGVGINGIASFTGMSKANVINKIKQISNAILKPLLKENQQEYEVDEMHTIVGSKNTACYITYALNKKTRKVIDFVAGNRTKEHIGKVINSIKLLNPKRLFTDKLNVYPGLIDKSIHFASPYKINHIERFNLTLRTHLKRLTRKTICFSKSKTMLESCLRIYLWAKA